MANKYCVGDLVGRNQDLLFLAEVPRINLSRRGKFRCWCGQEFCAQLSEAVKSSGCGCGRGVGSYARMSPIGTSGERYISQRRPDGKRNVLSYRVTIPVHNKKRYIGSYPTLELAVEARDKAILSDPELENRDIYLAINQ